MVIAGIMTAIGEATMAETVGVEVLSTLTFGAEVRLVAPISSLTCHAIAVGLISTVPNVNACVPKPLHPLTSLL